MLARMKHDQFDLEQVGQRLEQPLASPRPRPPGLDQHRDHRHRSARGTDELADDLTPPPRRPAGGEVAELVAEHVVDELEVVDQQHHGGRPARSAPFQRLLERPDIDERFGSRSARNGVPSRLDRRPAGRQKYAEHRYRSTPARAPRSRQRTPPARRRRHQHTAGGPRLERQVVAQVGADRKPRSGAAATARGTWLVMKNAVAAAARSAAPRRSIVHRPSGSESVSSRTPAAATIKQVSGRR